jgi:hypothetical protein
MAAQSTAFGEVRYPLAIKGDRTDPGQGWEVSESAPEGPLRWGLGVTMYFTTPPRPQTAGRDSEVFFAGVGADFDV